MKERLRLGDMLVAAGLVTEAQVQEALSTQRQTGKRLGETLVAMGYVNEGQMTQVLSNQLSIPWANLYHVDFSRELLELIPTNLAERYRIIPVYVRHVRRQGDTLYVAMDDPLNLDALQLVADACGMPVKPMVASPTDIENAIRVYYLGLPPLASKPKAKADAAPGELPELEEDLALLDGELVLGEEAPHDGPDTQPIATETTEWPPTEPMEAPPPEPWGLEPEAPESDAAPWGNPASEEAAPPAAAPEPAPPHNPRLARFLTLTLLDGTQVRLPSPGSKKGAKPEPAVAHGLTTRDLIHALTARAAGKDVSDVLPDDAWEPLLATLLSVLMRKGLLADWEFVDEWKKHRKKSE